MRYVNKLDVLPTCMATKTFVIRTVLVENRVLLSVGARECSILLVRLEAPNLEVELVFQTWPLVYYVLLVELGNPIFRG